MTNRKANWKGMNWCRQEKRLAIYLRDGLACVYCGDSVERGAQLSLDHIKPHCKGGDNKATNLVTCCCKCNSSRAARPVKAWAQAVAAYLDHGVTAVQILARVKENIKRPLDVAEAKKLIARRGSAAKVLDTYR